MLVIPAIDLLETKVVRLYKGSRKDFKVYSNAPLEVALQWKEQGAELLHIVDLNAAFGEGDNLEIIEELVRTGIPIEVGGGIRSKERAEALLSLGVERVIIGTKALDGGFLKELLKQFGEDKIGVSVDASRGKVKIKGWQKETIYPYFNFMEEMVNKGIRWIIYTDIEKDGTLEGFDPFSVENLKRLKGVNIIIAGGINSSENVLMIKEKLPFIYGVIVGKALYEGQINLKELNKKLLS